MKIGLILELYQFIKNINKMNLIIIKHINCLLKYKDKFLKAKLIFSLDYRATYILKKKKF